MMRRHRYLPAWSVPTGAGVGRKVLVRARDHMTILEVGRLDDSILLRTVEPYDVDLDAPADVTVNLTERFHTRRFKLETWHSAWNKAAEVADWILEVATLHDDYDGRPYWRWYVYGEVGNLPIWNRTIGWDFGPGGSQTFWMQHGQTLKRYTETRRR